MNTSARIVTVAIIALSSLVTWRGDAHALDPAFNVSAGPTISFGWQADDKKERKSGTWAWGWEGGAGAVMGAVLRLNVGQSFHPDGVLTYGVIEPWLLVGGTFGTGWKHGQWNAIMGIWEGLGSQGTGWFENGGIIGCNGDFSRKPIVPVVSLAVGYRSGGGRREFYLAPKAGLGRAFCF